jgi:hypothetical protein
VVRGVFWICVLLLPASFIGLGLYYLAVSPTRDDFYVGAVGANTGAVLLVDGVIASIGLLAFCGLLIAGEEGRKALWITVGLSAIAVAATYGIAMQILRLGFSIDG